MATDCRDLSGIGGHWTVGSYLHWKYRVALLCLLLQFLFFFFEQWQTLHLHPCFRHSIIVKVTRSPVLATLCNQSDGISSWFDCYMSDWDTTDWSAYWLFGLVIRFLGLGGWWGGDGVGAQGKRQKAQSFVFKDSGFKDLNDNKNKREIWNGKNLLTIIRSILQQQLGICW